jgi:hypothetical protein
MIFQRSALLKVHISDKLQQHLYSLDKPEAEGCLVSTQEAVFSAERKRVYVTICPGEFLDIDRMNNDLIALLQASVSEIKEYVRNM